MKVLLQKLACFFGVLLLIKLGFVVFRGDKFIYEKTGAGGNQFEAEYRKDEFAKEPYDSVFIGSSRTSFAISPAYFDKLTHRTKSYNFGIIAGKPPQTFDWCAELMQTKSSLKYVFFELSGGLPDDEAKDKNRILTFFKPSVPREEFEDLRKGFGLPLQNIPLAEFLAKRSVPAAPSRIFSLEAIRLSRLRNLRIEQESLAASEPSSLNAEYWSRIAELISFAEAKQIRLYFFVPPRILSDSEANLILPIYQKLDGGHKLKVAHYDETLYRPATSFDNSHLNPDGAKRFTELMAEAFDRESQ